MTRSASQRLTGLDLAKVLALYFVVLYHLTFRNSPALFTGQLWPYVEYFLTTLMSCCVPLLFAVSGALALRKPVNLRQNTKRSLQVLLLGGIWAVLSLAVVLALRREPMGPSAFLYTAWDLTVGYIQHLWFMPTFFFLCLMTPVMQSLRTNSPKIYRYSLLILGIYTFGNLLLSDCEYLLRWAMGKAGHTGNREFFWYTDFFGYHYWYAFVYYALGAALVEHQDWLRRYQKLSIVCIPLCLVWLTLTALARCYVRGTSFDPVFNNYSSVATLLLTASILLLLLEVRAGPRLAACAKAVSTRSLGIYLIHWLLIEGLLDYFPAVTNTNRFAPLTAVVVMALSWGLCWICERIPLVKDLFTVSPAWVRRTKTP